MPILHKCSGCDVETNRLIKLEKGYMPLCRHCQDRIGLQEQILKGLWEKASEMANAPYEICAHEVGTVDVLRGNLDEIFNV